MSMRPTLSRETAMLERGKVRLLRSGDFLTAEAFAVLAQLGTEQSRAELEKWKRAGNIFSLVHEDKEYFPLYAFIPLRVSAHFRRWQLSSRRSVPASLTGLWRSGSAHPIATWGARCRRM